MALSHASTWSQRLSSATLVTVAAFFSLAFVFLTNLASPLVATILLSGMAASLLIVGKPFLGVWMIYATVQQVGWTGPLFRGYYTELVTILLLVGIAIGTYRLQRNERFVPDGVGARLAVVLLLSIGASLFVARSFSSALDLVIRLSSYVLLLLIALRETTSTPRVRLLVIATVLSMAVSSTVGVADFALGTSFGQVKGGQQREDVNTRYVDLRFSGSASEATNSSKMMLLGVGVAAIMALRSTSHQSLYALAALMGCLGIAAAGSRGTYVAMAAGVGWICMKYIRSRYLPMVIIALVAVVGLSLWFMPDASLERLQDLSEPSGDSTTQLRWAMNLVGLQILMEHPLLGVGPAQFGLYFREIENRFVPGYQPFPRPLHNMYLAVAVEHGLIALLAFVALIFVALRDLEIAKRGTDSNLAILAEAVQFGLGLYLIAAVFDPVHQQRLIWLTLGLALAVGQVHRSLVSKSPGSTPTQAVTPG